MLYLIGQYFQQFDFLKSIYLRTFIAFVVAFLIVLIAGKPFINYLKVKKFGEKIRTEGPATHMSKKGTPTMGGVLIVIAVFITTILVADIGNKIVLLLLLSLMGFAGIGFVDDYKKFTVNKKGLSGKKKLLGQGAIGVLVWLYINYFGLTGNRTIDLSVINPIQSQSMLYIGSIGMLIFIIIIVMGASNAVNITDGLDGLAIMPMVICSAILGVVSYFTGHMELCKHLNLFYIDGAGEITVFLSAICGSGLGFLWYNFYPAQIFMGDTGSLSLGGVLGVIAILLKQELILPVVGGIFVIEAMSVIIQVGSFKLRGKRVFKMAPIHHHFELCGLPETKVTMRFWITTLLFGIVALGIIRMRGIF
ncbi:Phospho-N-acetylmuramoyl-pentapeptide-transferase [Fusobacterium sp. DD29]|uniref:phospho-N-acetylmuramoyl-pentapeptide- transferase n=1 Tax=unclassified Fusobacterium TaxID=2648384 RepID=UPI001B8D7E59|nr:MULTISPECIES: phospho-N-acetylmuramoyl-pentapeptide-transferase [unclassified Fusobacterium]MBR8701888.1 Phospho-N-acetylmuramoyl-pentapeptide-transferase [Fusobacterium sp. DD45]MBR8711660.1 Phospho-N-acetylmuramoyl-pentapeptide-transferase [Fusobacterium sp. DD28]MBR8749792.1 Phospho-N-acetylmuramoyl-pentapeptide-transferase [Fusobacterium sp. DD29]MBR8752218.1 Phospho-N-acetylmuramoyl-pentapeptide-transferase [Fusobacterium sp. DD26]MBR8762034.1 Phospho-N-acetylmuramoyl-pentapeptide-tran